MDFRGDDSCVTFAPLLPPLFISVSFRVCSASAALTRRLRRLGLFISLAGTSSVRSRPYASLLCAGDHVFKFTGAGLTCFPKRSAPRYCGHRCKNGCWRNPESVETDVGEEIHALLIFTHNNTSMRYSVKGHSVYLFHIVPLKYRSSAQIPQTFRAFIGVLKSRLINFH